jgi:hypothetical protein
MQSGNYFFLVFAITILATRIWLMHTKMSSPKIRGFQLHHYVYGLVFIAFALGIDNLTLFAVGMGLFVDELPMLLQGKWGEEDYHSARCLQVICVLMLVVFLLKADVLRAFAKF